MLRTEELPRERWDVYLDQLSRAAKNRPITVRVEGPKVGDQILAADVPLLSISIEEKGTERGAVEIIAESPDGTHLTHLIPSPQRIYVARSDERQEVCVDIEDADGLKTLVFCTIKGGMAS